ncbi:hypothetical protein CDCA_CDCA04G1388 [Cyanidium caldarium]|uniref:Major facilitator superfamily (MFS) profile domain-containing protein n=1 Tax=Cyanidium caldarium TaxID=2771 RepID=A0AAV9ISW9_CYACA|nr:hypothetical protein CDCA_CDCA04G1388 [Cyanidium caldarium]
MPSLKPDRLPTSPRLWVACTAASLGGLLFGYHVAVLSGVMAFQSFIDCLGESEWLQQTLTALLFVGALIGCQGGGGGRGRPHSATVADVYGRRPALVIASCLLLSGSAVIWVTPSPVAPQGAARIGLVLLLALYRLLCGAGVGLSNAVGPMYISELAPSGYRGSLVFLYQLCITVGILAAQTVNVVYGSGDQVRRVDPVLGGAGMQMQGNWRWPLRWSLLPASLMFFLTTGGYHRLPFVPESPTFLWARGEADWAKRVEQALGIAPSAADATTTAAEEGSVADSPTTSMPVSPDARAPVHPVSDVAPWRTALDEAALRQRLWIGFTLQLFQQLSGINAVLFYSVQIFESLNHHHLGASRASARSQGALRASLSVGVVNVLATLVAAALIDRCGRRRLYLACTPFMVAGLLMLAVSNRPALSGVASVSLGLLGVLLFVFFFAISHGPLAILLASELYPPAQRARASAANISVQMAATLLMGLSFLTLKRHVLGDSGTFMLFALAMSYAEWWIWRYVPETRGDP